MGNPLSCFVSNVFMGAFEIKLQRENKLPKSWLRYVDDVFAILKRNDVEKTLEMLNGQYKTIKFTAEIESNGYLPFLDLKLSRLNNKIGIDIHRKTTTTLRYITNNSFCSYSHRMAAFHSMVYRMCRLPLSSTNFMKELKYIKEVAEVNGFYTSDVEILVKKHSKNLKKRQQTTFYNTNNNDFKRVKFDYAPPITNKLETIFHKNKIKIVYTNNNKLKHLLGNPKDKLLNHQKSGIYEIKCECNAKYIGQTKRNILTRFKEHCSHIRFNRPTKSSVAEHVLSNDHLNINTNNLKLIKQINNKNELDGWESLFIHKNRQNIINTDIAPICSSLFGLI